MIRVYTLILKLNLNHFIFLLIFKVILIIMWDK